MKMVQRLKKSRIGRVVCRLFGEERGQVMMEYVIVAVLIAAAAVAAVAYFGKDIVAMFNTAGAAATGDAATAANMREEAKKAAVGEDGKGGYAAEAVNSNQKFSNLSAGGKKDGSEGK